MELLEYIEKCREVKETCGWPEEEKNMALRNEILVGLKTPLGYQKGLGEHQNMLATERVIEIATDIYNSDCQKSIEQTLSTVSTEVAAIQQRSSEVQKLHANQQDDKETVKGQDREGRYFEKKGRKEQGRSERQNCLVAELNLPIPHPSVQPEKSYVKSVEKKGHYQKCCKSKHKPTQVHRQQILCVHSTSRCCFALTISARNKISETTS